MTIKDNLTKGGLTVALTMGNKTFSIVVVEAYACLSEQGLPSGSINSAQTESGVRGCLVPRMELPRCPWKMSNEAAMSETSNVSLNLKGLLCRSEHSCKIRKMSEDPHAIKRDLF